MFSPSAPVFLTVLAALIESSSSAAVSSVNASSSATPSSNTTLHASTFAGATTSNLYPPASTAANHTLFAPESVVGFPGPTPTGAEPLAIKTAAAYPYNSGASDSFPLVAPQPYGSPVVNTTTTSSTDITKYWGNLAPWYSVQSADYGLPQANPLLPEGCNIVQMHLLYRHGARYPTSGAPPSAFAAKFMNASNTGAGVNVTGQLAFLSTWKYKLGAELLTPFGRSQNFELGVNYRNLYGSLLNNFTEQGTIPVFRTESQDRMVKTANNFAAGFFGVPEYLDQVNIEIIVESPGVNNSGAPYETCTNSNVNGRGTLGSTAATNFANTAFNSTIARLQSQITGLTLTATDIIAMLQLCSYETNALGYSVFCNLFTKQDFEAYEYYFDLSFYYGSGAGSPVAAAQGKAYLQEYVARFTKTFPSATSSLNQTFDNTTTYFPLNQSIYADATHEVVVLNTLVAFNLTSLFNGPPLNLTSNQHNNTFVASKQVPFATHFTTQVLECPAMQPTRQIRFIVNDAVVPLNTSYPGCPTNKDGLCSFDNVVSVLQKRINEIDWNYDCLGNYTASAGNNYNGRAPRS